MGKVIEMQTVDLDEAKVRLAELVSLARSGTEIVIEEEGVPLARIVAPTIVSPARATGERVPGLDPGAIWISDDFDEPLPDEFWLGES